MRPKVRGIHRLVASLIVLNLLFPAPTLAMRSMSGESPVTTSGLEERLLGVKGVGSGVEGVPVGSRQEAVGSLLTAQSSPLTAPPLAGLEETGWRRTARDLGFSGDLPETYGGEDRTFVSLGLVQDHETGDWFLRYFKFSTGQNGPPADLLVGRDGNGILWIYDKKGGILKIGKESLGPEDLLGTLSRDLEKPEDLSGKRGNQAFRGRYKTWREIEDDQISALMKKLSDSKKRGESAGLEEWTGRKTVIGGEPLPKNLTFEQIGEFIHAMRQAAKDFPSQITEDAAIAFVGLWRNGSVTRWTEWLRKTTGAHPSDSQRYYLIVADSILKAPMAKQKVKAALQPLKDAMSRHAAKLKEEEEEVAAVIHKYDEESEESGKSGLEEGVLVGSRQEAVGSLLTAQSSPLTAPPFTGVEEQFSVRVAAVEGVESDVPLDSVILNPDPEGATGRLAKLLKLDGAAALMAFRHSVSPSSHGEEGNPFFAVTDGERVAILMPEALFYVHSFLKNDYLPEMVKALPGNLQKLPSTIAENVEIQSPLNLAVGDSLEVVSRPRGAGMEEEQDYEIDWSSALPISKLGVGAIAITSVEAKDGDLFLLGSAGRRWYLLKVEHDGVAVLMTPPLRLEEQPSGFRMKTQDWWGAEHREVEASLAVSDNERGTRHVVQRVADGLGVFSSADRRVHPIIVPLRPISAGMEEGVPVGSRQQAVGSLLTAHDPRPAAGLEERQDPMLEAIGRAGKEARTVGPVVIWEPQQRPRVVWAQRSPDRLPSASELPGDLVIVTQKNLLPKELINALISLADSREGQLSILAADVTEQGLIAHLQEWDQPVLAVVDDRFGDALGRLPEGQRNQITAVLLNPQDLPARSKAWWLSRIVQAFQDSPGGFIRLAPAVQAGMEEFSLREYL